MRPRTHPPISLASLASVEKWAATPPGNHGMNSWRLRVARTPKRRFACRRADLVAFQKALALRCRMPFGDVQVNQVVSCRSGGGGGVGVVVNGV